MALFFFICGANLTHLWKQFGFAASRLPVCCRIPARAVRLASHPAVTDGGDCDGPADCMRHQGRRRGSAFGT